MSRITPDRSRGADAYGDPSAEGRMASSPDLPEEAPLPPADPARPNPGVCPHCGQQQPNPVNTFATGSNFNDPSLRSGTREFDNPLEPDGESAHRVRLWVRDLYPQAANHPDATERVLAAIIAPGDFTYNQIDAVVRAEVSRLDALRRRPAQEV